MKDSTVMDRKVALTGGEDLGSGGPGAMHSAEVVGDEPVVSLDAVRRG